MEIGHDGNGFGHVQPFLCNRVRRIPLQHEAADLAGRAVRLLEGAGLDLGIALSVGDVGDGMGHIDGIDAEIREGLHLIGLAVAVAVQVLPDLSMITIKEPAIFAVMEPVQNAQKAVSDDPIN